MGKYRCAGCKQRFEVGTEFRRVGPSRYCSPDCIWESGRRRKGSSPTMRTSRGPAPIPASTRKEVLDRDGNKCRWCGTKSGLHLHHINYRSEGVDHSPQNLITLCHSHHSLVHSKKGVYKPLLRAYIWERYVNDNRWTLPILKKKLDRQTLRAGTKPSSI